MNQRVLGIGALAFLTYGCLSWHTVQADAPNLIRIGMVQSFFHDVPQPLIDLATEPFKGVMRESTGLQGQLSVKGDAYFVADRLNDGTYHLGVFHGQEFAWAQEKYPTLKPLMIAINENRTVQAYLLTRKDKEFAKFADLKGKNFALPRKTKEHCRLFIEKHCLECGLSSKDFFQEIAQSSNVESALDDLTRGKVHAVVVDRLGLEFYKDLKPGCFSVLKVSLASEEFPAPVIAYRVGTLDSNTLQRLQSGLISAHTRASGRIMQLWRVQAFEAIPTNYNAMLATILKAYPSPESLKVSQR